jgi:serine/threonine protein kinase
LYELAASKPPFDAANALALATKINKGQFARLPSRYSENLQDVIRRMLQVDPRKRPRVEDLETHPGMSAYSWSTALSSLYNQQQQPTTTTTVTTKQ